MFNLKYANILSPLTDSNPRIRLKFLFDAFVGPAMSFNPLIKLTDVDDTSDNAAGMDFAAYPFKRAIYFIISQQGFLFLDMPPPPERRRARDSANYI